MDKQEISDIKSGKELCNGLVSLAKEVSKYRKSSSFYRAYDKLTFLETQAIVNYDKYEDVSREKVRDLLEFTRNYINDSLRQMSAKEYLKKSLRGD